MKKVLLSFLLVLVTAISCTADKGNITSAESWTFAVITDTQGARGLDNSLAMNKPIVEKIAADIVKLNPDLVLVSGDLVSGWSMHATMEYDKQYAQWKETMKPVYDAGIRVYPVRGNHDSGPERLVQSDRPRRTNWEPPPKGTEAKIRKAFLNAFKEYSYIPSNGPKGEARLEYSFEHKNAFFIGMDTYNDNGGQHRINLDWVTRQLAVNKKPHVFIYGHEPAFEMLHRDNLSYYPEERDKFWDTLGASGGRIYFCGHDHIYNRALIKDSAGNELRQIIVSSGGGSLRKWKGTYKDPKVKNEYYNQDYHGYIIVTITNDKATIQWRALTNIEKGSWKIKDSFSYKAAR